jgi:excisionase family DNA binding protein
LDILEEVIEAQRCEVPLMEKKPPASMSLNADRIVEIEPLYDSHEIAIRCRVSEKSLHRWARKGMIPAVKFGRLWRFRKSAIDEWINSKLAS